jgi:DNA ligase 1
VSVRRLRCCARARFLPPLPEGKGISWRPRRQQGDGHPLLKGKHIGSALSQRAICRWWQELDRRELFLLNKILTGAFRVGVSDTRVVRAVAQMSGLPPATVAHRLMGEWTPSAVFFQQLISQEAVDDDRSRPYPFCLAYQLDHDVAQLGNRDDWLAEWKWDGIRVVYPPIYSTDLDDLRLLGEWHEVKLQ